jgi:epoxyqueuosine reductase
LNSIIIKHFAQTCGFSLCGIAKAEPLIAEKKRFEKALTENFHDKKAYLERDIDKRFNPAMLLEGCRSGGARGH